MGKNKKIMKWVKYKTEWCNHYTLNTILMMDDICVGSYIIYVAHKNYCILKSFYIQEDYRYKGYGTKMMSEFIDDIDTLTNYEVFLEVNVANTLAIDLYESYGFTYLKDSDEPSERLMWMELKEENKIRCRLEKRYGEWVQEKIRRGYMWEKENK